MDMVRGPMGSLLPKLLKLLGHEYNLQTGMKKKVKFIYRELESINAFLSTVSDVPWYELDAQTKVWAREAREASYDMEDVLDTFLVRFQDQEPANPSRLRRAVKTMASLFSKGKARRDIDCAIQDIKSRLQDLADRRARYRINDVLVNPASTSLAIDPRLQAMYKEAAKFVGIDKPRDDLISMLSPGGVEVAQKRKIVAIVGIGGLGKTTLAKGVYDNLRVDFECAAFVPVGRNPNLTKLLMDILHHLDKNKYENIHNTKRDASLLIDELLEFLRNKRYFIVIDDIWEKTSWDEIIELALLENNRGSRIIITTRNSQVATKIGQEVYKMQPLSADDSEKLFYTRIFSDERKCSDYQPGEVPNKILKKCGGIPLAIITMASLLVGKPRERWSDVLSSIGFDHTGNKQVENTMMILSYSYYDMPSYLRTCLLYISVFPEDYYIRKHSLIWRWIAEGFIQGKSGTQLFELGEQYFNDLVDRSMIQAVENKFNGMVEGFLVHDMVLDLIRSISSKENFVTILENDGRTVSPRPSSTRRVVLHDNTMDHIAPGNMVDMPQVRSFIAIRCAFGNQFFPISSYKFLRVLDLEGCENIRISHLVCLDNLLHLRYVGLRETQLDGLPNEIGGLKLLQTLNLEDTRITQLTPSISRLTQLVCLRGDLYFTQAPDWIGKLMSLEELHVAIYGSGARSFLKVLGSLRELRVFRSSIRAAEMDDIMQRDLVLSLRNLHKLQHLEFILCASWINANSAMWGEAGFVLPRHLQILHIAGINFSCLPSCISAASLPKLTHLYLIVHAMDEKGLEFLGRLPELCYLHLYTKSTITIVNIKYSNSHFQKLRFCHMPCPMIQFRCKEGDSSVLFHLWNGTDAIPFASSKNDHMLAPYAVMPNLEVLNCRIYARALKDGKGNRGNIGLEYLPSLRQVQVHMYCEGASATEVNEAGGCTEEIHRSTSQPADA